jgi:hypothetical protein
MSGAGTKEAPAGGNEGFVAAFAGTKLQDHLLFQFAPRHDSGSWNQKWRHLSEVVFSVRFRALLVPLFAFAVRPIS